MCYFSICFFSPHFISLLSRQVIKNLQIYKINYINVTNQNLCSYFPFSSKLFVHYCFNSCLLFNPEVHLNNFLNIFHSIYHCIKYLEIVRQFLSPCIARVHSDKHCTSWIENKFCSFKNEFLLPLCNGFLNCVNLLRYHRQYLPQKNTTLRHVDTFTG